MQTIAQAQKDLHECFGELTHAELLTIHQMVSDPGFILGEAKESCIGLVRNELMARLEAE